MKVQLLSIILGLAVLQVPAPEILSFSFYRQNGTMYTRENIPKGRYSFFLFVDPACEHCQKAIGNFNAQYTSFASTNIFIITLAGQNALQTFLTSYAPGLSARKNVVLLLDKQNSFINLFGPRKYPGMFLYNKKNQLVDYEDDGQNIFRFVNELKKKK